MSSLTDEQISEICPDGNPPEFQPFKPTKRELAEGAKEKWNHGKWGGVVHVAKDATAEKILDVCKVTDAKDEPRQKTEWKPTTQLEKSTDALMTEIGAKHTDEHLTVGWRDVNPDYKPHSQTSINCQRCVPTVVARIRGYDVTAKPKPIIPSDKEDPIWDGLSGLDLRFPAFKNAEPIRYSRKSTIEAKMAEWGDGAIAQIDIAWKGSGAHTFFAIQKNGKTIFHDSQGYSQNENVARNAAAFFDRMVKSGRRANKFNYFARVDNLEFSERAKLCFVFRNSV